MQGKVMGAIAGIVVKAGDLELSKHDLVSGQVGCCCRYAEQNIA